MAVSHIASAGKSSISNSGTHALSASITTGDLVLYFVTEKGGSADPAITDDDSGGNTWAKYTSSTNGTAYASIWWKLATAATASKTVTITFADDGDPDNNQLGAGGYAVYRGVGTSQPPLEHLSAQSNSSGTESHASITPTFDGSMVCLNIFQSVANNVTAEACTSPGTLQERFDASGFCRCTHASEVQTTAGPTGSLTWAQTNSTTVSIVFNILPVAEPYMEITAATYTLTAAAVTGTIGGSNELVVATDAFIDAAITGLTPSVTKPTLSFKHATDPVGTRNTANWLTSAGVDITCISFYANWRNDYANVTLVHPYFGISAVHESGDLTGQTLAFLTNDNTPVVVTVVEYHSFGDIGLYRFSTPATNILPAYVLPPDDEWRGYAPHISWVSNTDVGDIVASVVFDKDGNVLCNNWNSYVLGGGYYQIGSTQPHDATRATFWEAAGSFDSSGPICWVIDSKLVVLGLTHVADWLGQGIAHVRTAIEASMDSQISGAAMTEIDLSGYFQVTPNVPGLQWRMQPRQMQWALGGN